MTKQYWLLKKLCAKYWSRKMFHKIMFWEWSCTQNDFTLNGPSESSYVYNYMYMLARTVLPAIPSITLKILCNFYILELHCVDNVETLVWGQWALDRRDGKHFTRQRRFFSISLSCKPVHPDLCLLPCWKCFKIS